MDNESDAALIQRMQSGDQTAVAAFYRRYLGVLWRFVRVRTPQNADARDIVGETFLAAIRGVGLVAPNVPAASWLMGIARHKLADGHRRAGRHRDALDTLSRRAPPDEVTAALVAGDDLRRLRQVLADMPDEDRTILEWKYLEGLSVREIVARTARSEKAVESALYRARLALRDLMAARPQTQEGQKP